MLPAATHGDLKQVPITHSDPGSERKLDDIKNITPISVACPALPSALILELKLKVRQDKLQKWELYF